MAFHVDFSSHESSFRKYVVSRMVPRTPNRLIFHRPSSLRGAGWVERTLGRQSEQAVGRGPDLHHNLARDFVSGGGIRCVLATW
jgi:hypothetical protein